jgi:hypothetical protein
VCAAITLALVGAFAIPSHASVAPPTITQPAAGSTKPGAAPTRVTIAGTAEPGSSVEVFDTMPVPSSIGTATAGGGGSWTMSVAMSDGSHSIDAIATGDDGIASAPSAVVTFAVDAVAPGLQIATPEDDFVFGPGVLPEVTGTATDERELLTVKLEYWRIGQLELVQLADCECDDQTQASWSHSPALEPGTYNVKLWSYDAAGNKSMMGTVDFTTVGSSLPASPATPELPGVPEIAPPDILGPDPSETHPGSDRPVNFGGTTEPGSTVELFEELQGLGAIGSAVDDDGDGTWSAGIRLGSGVYGVRARAIDEDGNVSALGDLLVVDVDADRPILQDLPQDTQVFLPTQEVVIQGGLFDKRATGYVVLEYWFLNDIVYRALADCGECGERQASWSDRPVLPGPGTYHVRVLSFDAAGNPSHEGEMEFVSGAL